MSHLSGELYRSSRTTGIAWRAGLSITVQHTQENLCRAHIQAIAAMAGVNLGMSREQDYGIDGHFDPVVIQEGRRVESGFPICFQAKATINWSTQNGCIGYDLEAKSFNDLARRSPAATTMILILLCLPRDQVNWHSVSASSTALNHCCYWHVIRDGPTDNAMTKRIHIPVDQLLTPTSLLQLLEIERMRRIGA